MLITMFFLHGARGPHIVLIDVTMVKRLTSDFTSNIKFCGFGVVWWRNFVQTTPPVSASE